MDEHLEFLRIENKKLRGRHDELESNLTEEREMVKYLHGVIKNYQQLLKKPDSTRHLKTSLLKKSRQSVSVGPSASESDAEEFFVKKLVEMSADQKKRKGGKEKDLQRYDLVQNDDKQTALVDTSYYCENGDRVNTNRGNDQRDTLASRTHPKGNIEAELTRDTSKASRDVSETKGGHVDLDFPAVNSDMEKHAETKTKYERGDVFNDMAQMLDSMMDKTVLHENDLKQKDKHLTKMERRYEYLASLALGEESEWL